MRRKSALGSFTALLCGGPHPPAEVEVDPQGAAALPKRLAVEPADGTPTQNLRPVGVVDLLPEEVAQLEALLELLVQQDEVLIAVIWTAE